MEYICLLTKINNPEKTVLALRTHYGWGLEFSANYLRMLQNLMMGTHEPIVLDNAIPAWEFSVNKLIALLGGNAEIKAIRVVGREQLKKEQEEKEFRELQTKAQEWLRNADPETQKWVRILSYHHCPCMPTA